MKSPCQAVLVLFILTVAVSCTTMSSTTPATNMTASTAMANLLNQDLTYKQVKNFIWNQIRQQGEMIGVSNHTINKILAILEKELPEEEFGVILNKTADAGINIFSQIVRTIYVERELVPSDLAPIHDLLNKLLVAINSTLPHKI